MSRGPYELPTFDVDAYAASLMAKAGAPQAFGQPGPSPAPPQPPAPRSPLLNVWVAWIVIGVSVLVVFGSYFRNARLQKPDVTDPSAPVDPRFEIASRYAVGALHLAAQAISASGTTQPADSPVDAARGIYLAQVEKSARTLVDRLRLVAVIGELDGKEAAVARLTALQGKLQNVDLEHDAALLRAVYEQGAAALSAHDRDELVEHHGWFGRLALAWRAPPGDGDAQTVFAQATRTFAASLSIVVIALGALLAGLVLFVFAMVLYADGRVRLAYERSDRATFSFLEAFAVYVGGYTALAILVGRLVAKSQGLSWLSIAVQLFVALLAMFWPLLRGTDRDRWRRGLGWHTGRGLLREMGMGLVGYVAGMPIIFASVGITLLIVSKTGADATHPLINWARGGMRSAWPLYLLASLYAPLVEETLFRGALFHHLRGRHRWWTSTLLVSVIFAAMHPQGWAAIPALAGIAIVFAGIREWRGTMFASATAHALHNGILVTVLIFSLS